MGGARGGSRAHCLLAAAAALLARSISKTHRMDGAAEDGTTLQRAKGYYQSFYRSLYQLRAPKEKASGAAGCPAGV